MPSRLVPVCLVLLLIAPIALAQSDRGTITGTVSDATNAVIPGVSVVATNSQTGVKFETVTTESGNYTLPQLPAGVYEVSAELPGFRKFIQQGVTVLVAQTLRVNVRLELGSREQAITVTADAALLRTESGDLSHNVTTERLTELPILSSGASGSGSSAIRNPLAETQLIPGTFWQPNTNVVVNGLPTNSETIRIEGQDSTNRLIPFAQAQTQPSVDAIREVSIQTSNYAAEFGQAGGGIFNYTMKSGTNEYHGSVFDMVRDDALNAGTPFTSTGGSNKRSDVRSHNWGWSFGGPLRLGNLYDGRNKTFFFFNFEQFRETQSVSDRFNTIPTLAMRNGDFSQALTGRQVGVDPLGRPIMEGQIFDPATERLVNGQVVRDPFPNNQIPLNRMDPVALKIQSLIPLPDTSDLVNNFRPNFPSKRYTTVPSFKVDHTLNARHKLSFYWQRTETSSQFSAQFGGADGLPAPVTAARGTFIESWLARANWDYTISPALLLHVGVGNQHNDFKDDAPTLDFNAAQAIGLKGTTTNRQFPQITGLLAGRGGVKNLGPGPQSRSVEIKPSANASLSWVSGNHSYKFGSEYFLNGFPTQSFFLTAGLFNFSAAQTGQVNGTTLSGTPIRDSNVFAGGIVGFPYASFLLGQVNNGDIRDLAGWRYGKQSLGFFAQDTWKVTPTLTLDYGLRWDYFTYLKENEGRLGAFSPTTPNPAVGGLLGAAIFEGDGPGRCNCDFADNYPWAVGPRLGVAWNFISKTVLRGGWGVSYTGTHNNRPAPATENPFQAQAFGQAAFRLQDGIPITQEQRAFPKIDPGVFPINGNPIGGGAPVFIDPEAGRPGRIFQFSAGLQREINRNLMVEASYVGNRGVWLLSNGLNDINANTPERLASFGLDINNAADRALLTSRLNAPLAAQRGFNTPPFPGFPLSATVAQSLRPYPQFQTISANGSHLGKSWYDSLQVKATQRVSHGLDFTGAFTWQKELNLGAENENGFGQIQDVFKRDTNKTVSSFSRPFTFVFATNYRMPQFSNLNRALSVGLRDWQFGAVLRYASGRPIAVPFAQNQLNQLLLRDGVGGAANGTRAIRVEGEPLFSKDINGSIDPKKDFVLNPNAFRDPAPGEFGGAAPFLDEFRQRRFPMESVSLQRVFRLNALKEGARVQIRVEFDNILNRVILNNPSSNNARATQTRDANGNTVSGFGRIDPAFGFTNNLPRTGQIIAKFIF